MCVHTHMLTPKNECIWIIIPNDYVIISSRSSHLNFSFKFHLHGSFNLVLVYTMLSSLAYLVHCNSLSVSKAWTCQHWHCGTLHPALTARFGKRIPQVCQRTAISIEMSWLGRMNKMNRVSKTSFVEASSCHRSSMWPLQILVSCPWEERTPQRDFEYFHHFLTEIFSVSGSSHYNSLSLINSFHRWRFALCRHQSL